ncbi:hypothetical protein ACI8AV_13145 [Geodermatophilus sp. SYSU D00804]
MSLAAPLPGITFEPVPRPPADALPRMDICAFVGFASSGPVDVPVLVEDAVTFRDVFGPDPVLARTDDGTAVRGQLGPAVEGFFGNGGARAWVVRVAATGEGGAVTNRFPVPGLVVPGRRDGTVTGWRLLALPARSPGAWSDGLRAGACLQVAATRAAVLGDAALLVEHGTDVVPGDALLLTLGGGRRASVPVTAVAPAPDGIAVDLDADAGWLLSAAPVAVPPRATVRRITEAGTVDVPGLAVGPADPTGPVVVDVSGTVLAGDALGVEAAAPGGEVTMLWVGEPLLDPVGPGHRFPVQRSVSLRPLPAAWTADRDLVPSEPVPTEVQRLRLTVRDTDRLVAELDGLGLGPGHHRGLAALPDDDTAYSLLAGIPRTGDGSRRADPADVEVRVLTAFERETLGPRFPLAAPEPGPAPLPVGLTTDPAAVVLGPAPAEVGAAPAPDRDGTGSFSAALFVDPALAGLGVDTVLPTARELAFVQDRPRRLRGIHATVALDEVTLLSVPDAVHTGWDRTTIPPPQPLAAPVLTVAAVAGGAVHLTWTAVPGAGDYEIEHGDSPVFPAPRRLTAQGTAALVDAGSRCPRAVYARVRARRGIEPGPWSDVVVALAPAAVFEPCDPVGVPPRPPVREQWTGDRLAWRARPRAAAEGWLDLRAVQTAALRWCAARGDVLVLLALPGGSTTDDAVRHAGALRGGGPAFTSSGRPALPSTLAAGVPALTEAEAGVLDYGALYHPWPVVGWPSEGGGVRPVPPDGAVAGTYAARALSRGAWTAPARRPLAGVVGLDPVLDPARHADLSAAGVNPVAADPSGFLALTATTMSRTAALRPVNVRRLVMLLRRLADREGVGVVFEPHDAELRRIVQLRFDRLLTDLFRRGALAGATPGEAFEVSTGTNVNPPAAVDLGRFTVEVRIAPSRPLEFLTVRLVLTGGTGTREAVP